MNHMAQCQQVGIWRHFKSIKPRIIPASLHRCEVCNFQDPEPSLRSWGSRRRTHRLVGLGNRNDDGQHADELEDGPRKSPYRSRFSRNVGSGTSGGEKSRSEAMAPAACCLKFPPTHRSPEPTSKFKELMSRFYNWCLNGSTYTNTPTYMQEYVKQLWWNVNSSWI